MGKQKLERRASSIVDLRVTGKARQIGGHAVVWDSVADLGSFTEVCRRGMFQRCLSTNPDIRMLWSHDDATPLARTRAGNLRLHEDSVGLAFEADLVDTQAGRDCYELVRSGTATGVSFGFNIEDEDGDQWDGNRRELHHVNLWEISPCVWPAYESSSVAFRSMTGSVLEKIGLYRNKAATSLVPAVVSIADMKARAAAVLRELRLRSSEQRENDNGCGCDCDECIDNRCPECSNQEDDDEDCLDCPWQEGRMRRPAGEGRTIRPVGFLHPWERQARKEQEQKIFAARAAAVRATRR